MVSLNRCLIKYFIIVIQFIGWPFQSFCQNYEPLVADYVKNVDHPYTFLKKIEELGLKESGTKGLDSTHAYLTRLINGLGYSTQSQDFLNGPDTLRNIVFTKEGSSDSTIILCAHYDSKNGPGVNDNGTGDFALYELAKWLKPLKSKYSVTFIYFSGEELGFKGSEFFVEKIDKALLKIKFVLNMDQLGGTLGEDNSSVKCERDEISSQKQKSNEIARSLAKMYSLYTNLTPEITPAYSSDYIPFRDSGYIIAGIYQYSPFPYYHTSSDLLKYMEFNSLISTVKGALAALIYFSEATIIKPEPEPIGLLNVYYHDKALFITSSGMYSIRIFDGLGRQIFYEQNQASIKIIPLQKINEGIYFAYITSDSGATCNKFLQEP